MQIGSTKHPKHSRTILLRVENENLKRKILFCVGTSIVYIYIIYSFIFFIHLCYLYIYIYIYHSRIMFPVVSAWPGGRPPSTPHAAQRAHGARGAHSARAHWAGAGAAEPGGSQGRSAGEMGDI
jgi:hypothetical protein